MELSYIVLEKPVSNSANYPLISSEIEILRLRELNWDLYF